MNHLISKFPSKLLLAVLALFVFANAARAQNLPPVLPPGCEELQVDPGHVVKFRAFAQGVQVYRFDPVTLKWTFSHPYALLYANAACTALIGIHTGGPTWMSFSGSSVVGHKLEEATVDPTAIPWLLLETVDPQGPGVFARTTFIQRINTVGGRAPAAPGTPGQIVLIPYTAEYVFYCAQ